MSVETPSKAAASALSNINLNTPTKSSESNLLAKMKAAASLESNKPSSQQSTKSEDVEDWRKRFVGDVDCEEKDEPLLEETNSRFVLFPIKYREVSGSSLHTSQTLALHSPCLDRRVACRADPKQIWQMYKKAQAS